MKTSTRFESLDHLRGLAAVMVLLAHGLHNLSRGMYRDEIGAWITTKNFFYACIAEGHAGVSLFIVLSGFLFMYINYNKNIDYGRFIKNRVLRIYPLYVVMVLCGAYAFSSSLTTGNLLGSLLLLQGTGAAHNGGMFTMILWTISTEFIFYLAFPFMNLFIQKYGWGSLLSG